MPSQLQTILDEGRHFLAAVSFVLALLQVYLGYRMLKFWISLAGFIIGFLAGVIIAFRFISDPVWVPLIIGAAAGALCSVLARKIYLAGVFIYCGCIASGAVAAISFPEGEGWRIFALVLTVVAFVAAGILAVRFARPMIIFTTSVMGSANAVRAWTMAWPHMSGTALMRGSAFAVLAVSGMAIQFLTTHGEARRRRR